MKQVEVIIRETLSDDGRRISTVLQGKLIRCKDCKWLDRFDDNEIWCGVWCNRTDDNAYCSYAERRQDEQVNV